MGFDRFPALYWFYLILAIIVSLFSLTYWIYKFSQWWKRRNRRLARRLRSLQEQHERLAILRTERLELDAQREELQEQLESSGALARMFRKRFYQGQLKELQLRELEIETEIEQLERTLPHG